MQKSFLKILKGLLAAVVVGFVAFVVFYVCVPRMRTWRGMQAQRDTLKESLDAINVETQKLKRDQVRFSESAEFVERLARENRRVAPNETVFIFE